MTPREKLELLRSYRAAGGTGSYASLLKGAKEYSNGGPKSKLPPLPSYTNIQPTQDNIRMQYTPIDPIQRDVAEVEARKLRVAKREKELQEYYSQPGMVSSMKRKPTPSEIRAHAESSVAYNDKLYNDPVGTLGPDIVMSVIPELTILKGPQQTISRGLNKLNPFKGSNPWSKVSDIPAPKFISEIDWVKWNPEIPANKPLMQEYHAIEQSAKRNGTWMKNPDGTNFPGTPEQFVQQNSQNFKKAFGNSKLVNPDGSPTILYHGSAKKFDTFDESKFQLGDSGYSGVGIYTTPSKSTAQSYAISSSKFHSGKIEPTVYELYGQANNPISSSQLIKENKGRDLFNFHRKNNWKGELTPEESLMQFDAAIADQLPNVERIRPWNDAREIVFPSNKQLKSAIGNNGMFDMTNPNIYKALLPVGLGTGLYNKTTNN